MLSDYMLRAMGMLSAKRDSRPLRVVYTCIHYGPHQTKEKRSSELLPCAILICNVARGY